MRISAILTRISTKATPRSRARLFQPISGRGILRAQSELGVSASPHYTTVAEFIRETIRRRIEKVEGQGYVPLGRETG